MRAGPQAIGRGLSTTVARRRWRSLISEVRRKRREAREHELEVIERLAREERDRRRAGSAKAGVDGLRRWC
jgi:hypothetical protein